MIDMGIVLEVERDPPAIVELHRHAVGRNALDLSQRAVLHAKAALVFQEHDAVAAGEVAWPPLGRHAHVRPQLAGVAQTFARGLVQIAHLSIGVGEDDPRLVRIGKPLRVPAAHQLAPRSFARVGRVDHAVLLIGMDRLAGAARRQRLRGVALPVLMLPANVADFGRAVALGQRAERRAGLDRLQLLGVADKNDLSPCPLGL